MPASAAAIGPRFVAPATRLMWPMPSASRSRMRAGSSSVLAPEQLERPERAELGQLLVERHPREQVGDAFVDRQRRIAVARVDRGHQPFTEPAVRPLTSWRSANSVEDERRE